MLYRSEFLFEQTSIQIIFRRETVDGEVQTLTSVVFHLVKNRDYIMTNLISEINSFLVGIILNPLNIVFFCESLNLISVRPKQRTDVEDVLRLHSFETFDTRTAQEVDKECLNLVVAMMS